MDHEKDIALISELGGPRTLAETLGYEGEGGVQRVRNWLIRGIPASVKLDRPDLFLRELSAPQHGAASKQAKRDERHDNAREGEPRNRRIGDKPAR